MLPLLSQTPGTTTRSQALWPTLVLLLSGLFAQAAAPTLADQKYGTAHERQVLDFWKAKSNTPTPVVIYFHGGGFKMGDKGMIRHSPLIGKFLKSGISVASANYPFLKKANYLEIMAHAARSVQFLRSKANEWKLDPTRIGAFGTSAGALISEYIGYAPDRARANSKDPVEKFSSKVAVVGSHMQPMGTEFLTLRYMRAGGPPLFIHAPSPPSDSVHHPKYAKMVKNKADALKIPCEMYGSSKNDIPAAPGGDTANMQVRFFLKHFKWNIQGSNHR